MKERILGILLIMIMLASMLTACGSGRTGAVTGETPSNEGIANTGGYELALVTDVGTIDDKSFNQGAWEGVVQYAKDNDITHKYYQPSEKSTEAYIASIDLAIKGGAKAIVCPGYLFEEAIYESQTKYPDTTFIILDGAPHPGDYNISIEKNTLSVFYAEEQAGYLAGYATVEEGYTQLGFMGGIAVPAVIRFGYGYIQGADQAAKDLGISNVNIKYTYVGNFDASPENMARAAAWFNEGVEIIFACGGGVGNSVMKAAETSKTKVIGVDVDQATESETVITSAMKNLAKSVYDALVDLYAGGFNGGQSIVLDASNEGVALPMETSKFEKFTQEKYDEIYEKLANGTIKVENDSVGEDPTDVTTEIATVEAVE